MTINKVCGSGLKAVMLAAQAIATGDADIVVAGGQENMSASPHVLPGSRDGFRMGDAKLVDTMIVDGLWDVYNQYHMGITAENVAKEYGVSRAKQDEFAVASQNKAEAAQKAGRFKDEIVPVDDPAAQGRPGRVHRPTSSSRHGTTLDSIAGLQPAFAKDGTVTAANASGLNDGAAAVLVMTRRARGGARPHADGAHQGVRVDGRRSGDHGHGTGAGVAPRARARRLEARRPRPDGDQRGVRGAGAARSTGEMGWDTTKINVNGGAIALGHPIGASGCRVLVTLLHEMQTPRREEGPRVAVHRRRHGRRAGGRAVDHERRARRAGDAARDDATHPPGGDRTWQPHRASRS